MQKNKVLGLLDNEFKEKRILVIGDLMLDKYIYGEVTRISPEAPVPVIKVKREEYVCGGAANVAVNLANLGITVNIIGVLGYDDHMHKIKSFLRDSGINVENLVFDPYKPTITKTRVVDKNQHMIRIDREEQFNGSTCENSINELKILTHNKELDLILLSDYDKGTLDKEFCKYIFKYAKQTNTPVVVDPKGNDWTKYKGALTITPNIKEICSYLNIPENLDDPKDIIDGCVKLIKKLNLQYIVITLGENGIWFITKDITHFISTIKKDAIDVSGAGDTVISTFSAAISSDMSVKDSLTLGNIAAGIVIKKMGTTPIELDELRDTIQNLK